MRTVRRGIAILTFAAGAIFTCPCVAMEARDACCPSDPVLANLMAAADLVLIGRMDVPREQRAWKARKDYRGYLDIPVRVEAMIKGDVVADAAVSYFPQDDAYQPPVKTVMDLAGAPALLFLERADDADFPGLYFAGSSRKALLPATEQAVSAARLEAARQMSLLKSWKSDTSLPLYKEVGGFIAQLGVVRGPAQQQVFDQLEALGEAAVPAIIAQMDDRRPLLTQSMTLVNHSPSAFEAVRHYAPQRVVDGLAAMLNQLTKQSFGTIHNGGSDRQRDRAVAGWRLYLADRGCARQ